MSYAYYVLPTLKRRRLYKGMNTTGGDIRNLLRNCFPQQIPGQLPIRALEWLTDGVECLFGVNTLQEGVPFFRTQ